MKKVYKKSQTQKKKKKSRFWHKKIEDPFSNSCENNPIDKYTPLKIL